MSATSGGGGSVSEGSEAGGSSQSTMSVSDSPSTSFQTNLAAENVTKITLSDDNGAGGYVADVTGSKINLTLDERQQKEGIVNVAFDYEGGTNRGGGGGGGGGEFRSMNGSEKKDKVPEAVNLELVNMVPYSNGNGTSYGVPVNGIPGIPMKKDSEQVDMSTPYDEYFVPVNEHKKYMRGEKLYVTKDKRRPTSWRRCLSWIVACTVISVVLVVAILAGTGVILSQEPDLVKDASVGRNFAGSNLKPSVTDNSPTPTAEKLMYVPRSIESEFVIDNLDFDPALRDLNSSAYQQFTSSMEDQLKMLLFDKETLEFGASDVGIKVVNISRDPFKVNYRIGWNYKQGVNNPPEPIKMEDVKRRLVESLARNQGYIDKYHIDREAIKVNHVINACQIENGGCSHICYYNYITQHFTCTCPTHLVLDSTGKNCVAWSGSSEDDAVTIPSHAAYPGMPYESTANPVQEYEYNSNFQTGVHQGIHHQQEANSEHPEDSRYKGHMDQQHGNREPDAEPIPEATAESGLDQQDKFHKDFEVLPEPSPEPNVKDNHSEGHGRDMHSVSISDGDTSQYEHGIHSSHEATGFEAVPEPTAEPTSEGKHHDHAIYSVHTFGEPTPEPTPEPASESSSKKDHDHDSHSTYDSKNHVHTIHSTYDFKDHEPAAEPTAEPTPEPTAEPSPGSDNQAHIVHSVLGPKDHESTSEPAPEPAPEPNVESKDHAIHSVYESQDHEPVPAAESVPEPTPEPAPEPSPESAPEPTPEPAPEPTPEPAPEPYPGSDHLNLRVHPVLESKDRELTTEPTPEPAASPSSGSDDHSHVGYSVHEFKVHEPDVESTPEPTPEPAAEPNSDGRGHTVHPLYESKDREFGRGETTPGSGYEGQNENHGAHSGYLSKDNEPVTEATPKPNPEHQDKEYGVHSVNGTKDGPSEATAELSYDTKTHTVHGLTGSDQTAEYHPEPTPEPPSSDNDHHTRFTNTESSEQHGNKDKMETTTQGLSSQENVTPVPDSFFRNSSVHPVPNGEQTHATGHPNTIHPESQSEVSSENKSGHHMPHLQDVLIKRPDVDLKNKSTTPHDQNVLQNVEVTADGEPVIEEILIDKSRTKGHDDSEMPSLVTYKPNSLNESDRLKPDQIIENSPDFKSEIIGSSNSNPKNESVLKIKPSGDPNEMKTAPPESASVDPTIVQLATTLYSGLDGKEMVTDHTENPKYSQESTVTSNQGSSVNTRANHFDSGDSSFKAETETNAEVKSTPLLQDRMPASTIQPEIRHEYYTIPVAVEFSNSDESNNGKSKQENQSITSESKSEEPHTTEKIHLGHSEGSTESSISSNGKIVPSGGKSAQTEERETTTESQIATTMLFSVLSPDAIGGKISDHLTNENGKESNLRETAFENHPDHTENNQTTKSPEELSNNIKDELLDNEEFNTLIHKEHNKEGDPNVGKEILNKYPSKATKVEKKKLDYIKGGDKVDPDKETEVTPRPGITPEDFILQKHVNGNENTFDLDYSLQNQPTTKHDGEVTVVDSHGFDVVPGVSFKPHGINNHDLKVLQTVAPDFRTQTGQTHELDTQKPDSKETKVKSVDFKEGEKQDKDYAKFDKDYKYEKQKVSKKKDFKKKGGSGKDGKNVELDDGRKYFTEVSKEDLEISHETAKDISETMSPFEKITVQPEIGVRLVSVSATETTAIPEHDGKMETTSLPNHANTLEKRTEVVGVAEHTGQSTSAGEETGHQTFQAPAVPLQEGDQLRTSVDQSHHQMIDEPSAKTTLNISPGTIHDGQVPELVNSTGSRTTYVILNSSSPFTNTDSGGFYSSSDTPGTVYDGMRGETTPLGSAGFEINGTTFATPKIVMNEGTTLEHGPTNTTTANPTIIIHGQSGNLQDGHNLRFANSTFHNPGNATVISVLNGSVSNPDGHTFTFTNYTTFPNGSTVQPTIIVRGQSGTLQDGHEIRFGNTTFVTSLPIGQQVVKNSTIYKIENSSLPDTVFDGQYNPQNGFYHMFSNSTGTFVYSNVTTQPAFIIKGEGGDFGNSRAYIMTNDSGNTFSGGFTGPSVIFRNSTVFAVKNALGKDVSTAGIQDNTTQPQNGASNETIHYTRQMSPNFFSTGTAYKVNDYFGYISKCAAGLFQCVNGTSKRGSACISLSSKCDSINDCSDGSDELGCVENGCPGNFQCSDGSCLKRNLVCNGILDCSDGSDEKQCENWKCEFDEFQCPSGRCIPVVWQCDGKPDCDNHTDEYNCQTSCGNDEFLCPEGWCVPLTYRCNGVKECSMGEDEQLCDCSHEEFKCQTGGCVSMKQICDGLDDCPDRSDEWDCVKLEPVSNLLKIRTASGAYESVCADNWTSRNSDQVCASLGYYSSVPMENGNSSSITTETSFFILRNGSTDNFNKKVIVNLKKSEGSCSSGKLVEIACQEFSCGSRSMTDSSSVEARLVGGMSATAGQWPSVALLHNIRNFHSCTANVLTPRWVLASYNCLKMGNKNLNEQDWKFFGGSTVFETEKENAETRKVMSIIPHPQVKFNQFLFSNDLALVELDQSLQFTNKLGAVCLPEQEMQPRQICVTAGWGMNTPEDKSIRQQLQYLPVPTMNLTECNSTEHYSGFITDDKICAGYNSAQKSLCYNEEGAPLMCVNDRGEWELQGVLSYHSNCGRGSHPSIFSSITPVTDWIKKTVGNSFERKTVAVTKR